MIQYVNVWKTTHFAVGASCVVSTARAAHCQKTTPFSHTKGENAMVNVLLVSLAALLHEQTVLSSICSLEDVHAGMSLEMQNKSRNKYDRISGGSAALTDGKTSHMQSIARTTAFDGSTSHIPPHLPKRQA